MVRRRTGQPAPRCHNQGRNGFILKIVEAQPPLGMERLPASRTLKTA